MTPCSTRRRPSPSAGREHDELPCYLLLPLLLVLTPVGPKDAAPPPKLLLSPRTQDPTTPTSPNPSPTRIRPPSPRAHSPPPPPTDLAGPPPMREDLLGQRKKAADDMSRVAGLDNQGIVSLQRQVMKEQDEGLEKLGETVLSTKHIALAVNEELTLHARLIDDLEDHVDVINSRLQRVQKRLAILNKHTKGGCSCMCLLLSVTAIVILAVIVWLLIKYL